jgi:hypothetical protein
MERAQITVATVPILWGTGDMKLGGFLYEEASFTGNPSCSTELSQGRNLLKEIIKARCEKLQTPAFHTPSSADPKF